MILALGPASGAHFNPLVTLSDWWLGGINSRDAIAYAGAQFAGAVTGVMAANAMYGLPLIDVSHKVRNHHALGGGEAVATFGLMLVIWAACEQVAASRPAPSPPTTRIPRSSPPLPRSGSPSRTCPTSCSRRR